MSEFVNRAGLSVNLALAEFIETEALPDTGINQDSFWQSFSQLIEEFTPRNKQLLKTRDELQAQIDRWCLANRDGFDADKYKKFLYEIGYLVKAGDDFKIDSDNVDREITHQAGPQLVVPTSNARFALNATNARWGSLYDALYGTNALAEIVDGSKGYDPKRGQLVIDYCRAFLDKSLPLEKHSHQASRQYFVEQGVLRVKLESGAIVGLANAEQFIGYRGHPSSPSSIILRNNDLHVILQVDRSATIGEADGAGISDITIEAAVTTIQDFEDSVSAVDAPDKIGVYRNWLGLMKGNLKDTFNKAGKVMTRELNDDFDYISTDGSHAQLHGRSLLLCRNVGLLMSNPAIKDVSGSNIQEGLMDAMISVLIARHDIEGPRSSRNSRSGSIYVVKPKMHGPDEAAFTADVFSFVESALGLKPNTVKVGLMDEERRTTLNLLECIRQIKSRVVFINTGFLDRTGDEIHTSMMLGPFAPKAKIKHMAWIDAYEDQNVDVGLACGFSGKAQIGKGMWAMPDEMKQMLEQKQGHPLSGANTAWVPSPNGASLHALHYHQVDVHQVQENLKNRTRASIDEILKIPLLDRNETLSDKQIQSELENNAQGILGYVVRWVDAGIGCSKVLDIYDIGLMEDRATLRISSQHIANWLEHNICDEQQVIEAFKRMAVVVDRQNYSDPIYKNIAPEFGSNLAFQAALDLVFKGKSQPSGYTEPLLHQYRLDLKRSR